MRRHLILLSDTKVIARLSKTGNLIRVLEGNVIVSIDGLMCGNPHDFDSLRNKTALNEENTYSLKIIRDGKELKLIAGALMTLGF